MPHKRVRVVDGAWLCQLDGTSEEQDGGTSVETVDEAPGNETRRRGQRSRFDCGRAVARRCGEVVGEKLVVSDDVRMRLEPAIVVAAPPARGA